MVMVNSNIFHLKRMPSSCLYKWSKKGDVVTHFRDYQLRIQDNTLTRQFRDLVQESQIDIVLEANIQQAIWYKLLVNLGINSITALGRQTVAIMHNPEIRTLCRQLLLDGCRVAQAEGLNFSEQTVDTIMTIYQGYPDEMGTSMYYDIVHQQPLKSKRFKALFIDVHVNTILTPHILILFIAFTRLSTKYVRY